jgi:uncharacterized protein
VLEVFVDSSAWYRFIVPGRSRTDGQAYEAVRAAFEEQRNGGARLATTSLVVAETHQLLLARTDRRTARRFLDVIPASRIVLVRPTEAQERAAITEWLDRFADQDFSLTDCVSFAVMRERRISRALALDRHFTIAGFERLPQLPPGVREAVLTPTTEG